MFKSVITCYGPAMEITMECLNLPSIILLYERDLFGNVFFTTYSRGFVNLITTPGKALHAINIASHAY